MRRRMTRRYRAAVQGCLASPATNTELVGATEYRLSTAVDAATRSEPSIGRHCCGCVEQNGRCRPAASMPSGWLLGIGSRIQVQACIAPTRHCSYSTTPQLYSQQPGQARERGARWGVGRWLAVCVCVCVVVAVLTGCAVHCRAFGQLLTQCAKLYRNDLE